MVKKRIGKAIGLAIALSMVLTGITPNVANVNTGKAEATTNNFMYKNGGPADPSMADEEKIVEMLKKEGQLELDATFEEEHEGFINYMKSVSESNNIELTDEQKSLEKGSLQNGSAEDGENAATAYSLEDETRNKVKEVNILAVMVEYSDFKHNQIQPGESGMYYKDYTREHYQDMLFGENGYTGPKGENLVSMKQYYTEQSGGSLKINGLVTPWYQVANTAKYYGEQVGSTNDIRSRNLVADALKEVGKDTNIDLSKFDKIDRYDLDGDGNYDEPDGIIDYLLLIHAGMGQEAGGGSLGSNAVWSHRWNLGGLYKIPNTNYRAYDYIMNPEDGATGVFAHEFGHDLGLPDEYDTNYSSAIGEPIGNWSIMSSGSWAGKIPGTEPTGISPFGREKLENLYGGKWQKQIELNYGDLTYEGKNIIINEASKSGDAIKVNLPDQVLDINVPTSGSYEYFGGKGNNITENNMSKDVDLTNTSNPTLTLKAWYDIEKGWDFASVQVREKGTEVWASIKGNITTTEKDPGTDFNLENGITGNSGGWVDGSFDLTAYAGKNIELKFAYQTDTAVFGEGIFIDDIKVADGTTTIFEDNAEGNGEFTLDGFTKHTGKKQVKHYYLIELRSKNGVDRGLSNFNYRGGLVSYDAGMVVWYVNENYNDNWTGTHPGYGYLSVVDADPVNSYWTYKDQRMMPTNNRMQLHDAAFSLRVGSKFVVDLSANEGRKAVDTTATSKRDFIDYDYYQNAEVPQVGVKLPHLGVQFKVVKQATDNSSATVKVGLN